MALERRRVEQLASVRLKTQRDELRNALFAASNCRVVRKLLRAASRSENPELSIETEIMFLAMRACFKAATQQPAAYMDVLELYDEICNGKGMSSDNNSYDELNAMALIASVSMADFEKRAIPLLKKMISVKQSWEGDALRAAALKTCLVTRHSTLVISVFQGLAPSVDEVHLIMETHLKAEAPQAALALYQSDIPQSIESHKLALDAILKLVESGKMQQGKGSSKARATLNKLLLLVSNDESVASYLTLVMKIVLVGDSVEDSLFAYELFCNASAIAQPLEAIIVSALITRLAEAKCNSQAICAFERSAYFNDANPLTIDSRIRLVNLYIPLQTLTANRRRLASILMTFASREDIEHQQWALKFASNSSVHMLTVPETLEFRVRVMHDNMQALIDQRVSVKSVYPLMLKVVRQMQACGLTLSPHSCHDLLLFWFSSDFTKIVLSEDILDGYRLVGLDDEFGIDSYMELVRVMQDLSLSTGGLAWDTYFSLLGMVVGEGRPDLVELIATQGSTCDMELQKRNGGVWMRTSLNSTYLGPNSEQASNLQELRSSILKKRVPLWIFAKNAVELWRWECCLSKLKATSIKMTKYGMFYPDDVLACFLPLPDPEVRDIVMGPLDLNLSPFSEQYPEHFNRLGAFITDYQLAVIQISTSHQCVFDWLITHRFKGDFGRDVELSGLETVTISQLPGAAIPKAERQEIDIAICDNLLFGQDFWKLIFIRKIHSLNSNFLLITKVI